MMMMPALHGLLSGNLENRHGHAALVDGEDRLVYGELARRVEPLAAWMARIGVEPGDRVALQLQGGPEEVIAILAAARIGAVVAPVHAAFRTAQLDHVLRALHAALLVTDVRRARDLSAAGLPPGLRRVLVTDGQAVDEAATSWAEVGTATAPPPPRVAPDDPAAVFYTSGSTGMPKGVIHTHRGLRAAAAALSKAVGNRPDDRLLAQLPLSASYGLLQLLTAFEVGAALVLPRAPFVTEIVGALASRRVTGFANTTHSWIEVVRHLVENPVPLPDLRYVTIAGATLPDDVLEALPRVLPDVEIRQCYGLTEAFRVADVPPDRYQEKRGALGRPLPGIDAFVVDPDHGIRGVGEAGELLVRSEFMTAGYWNAPEETARILRPCPHLSESLGDVPVLHTGDVVRRDEDGFLWFVGRRDAQFKVADYRVNPDEIERAMTATGLVAHAVVYGVEDASRGRVVHATVIRPEGRSVDVEALRRECRRRLSAHQVPVAIQVWGGEVPTVGPGKLDRARIIEASRS